MYYVKRLTTMHMMIHASLQFEALFCVVLQYDSFWQNFLNMSIIFIALFLFCIGESSPPLGFLPNIIILYADDLGYADLEGYGNPISITPHLDNLMKEGTKLTSFYVSSPVCSPSRAACM